MKPLDYPKEVKLDCGHTAVTCLPAPAGRRLPCPKCGTLQQVAPPQHVFTTSDLSSVSIDQSGDPKQLLWGKRRRRKRR